jgi:transcriptional regulator with XRE-family HTH domain
MVSNPGRHESCPISGGIREAISVVTIWDLLAHRVLRYLIGYRGGMATMGPTKSRHVDRLAGNLLRLARARKGMSQRELAEAAQVPQSMIARIESGARQPSLPLLARILAAVDLEPRIMPEAYDAHDDVLVAEDACLTDAQRESATQDLGPVFGAGTASTQVDRSERLMHVRSH